MGMTPKLLAAGSFSTTTADLYTTPANTTALIKSITLDAQNQFNLYIKPDGGSAIRIFRGETAGQVYQVETPFVLNEGDKLQGVVDGVTGDIDYTVSGAEYT